MRVKIENRDKLFKLNGIYLSHINLDESFEVIGIVNLFKKDYFIVKIHNTLDRFYCKSLTIVDNKIPDDWIYKKYDKPMIIKEAYDCFGYDHTEIYSYIGPQEFIENNFIFNLTFHNELACEQYNEYNARKENKQ